MKYATWDYYLDTDTNEKTTPNDTQGVCFFNFDESKIIGYLDDNANVQELSKWNVTELTEQEFYDLIYSKNNKVTMVNGKAVFPVENLA